MRKRVSKLIALGCLCLGLCSFSCTALAQDTVQDAIQEASNEVRQIGLMEYVETTYDESSGMITSEANAIMQDDVGYIWVGSYGGLSRYNGREFENLSSLRENAPRTGIRVLFQDSKKRIWIGTNDAGIYLFENEAFSAITQIAESPSSLTEGAAPLPLDAGALSVRSITEGADGTIYIGTTNGLFFVDDKMALALIDDEAIDGETIENLICDTNGVIWGSTGAGSMFVVFDGEVRVLFDRDLSGINLAYGLYQAQDGSIYIGTDSNYLMRLRLTHRTGGDDYTPENTTVEFLTMDNRETVNDVYQNSDGKLWICTDNGIGYLDENDVFYKINGMSSNTIMSQMCEDSEGNLWFASSRKGVIKLTKNKFLHIAYEADLIDQTVNATAIYDGCLYIATDNGLTVMDGDGARVDNDLTEMMKGIRIRSLMRDSVGRLWISTYKEYGLVCYDAKTEDCVSYTSADGLAHDQVRMACELSNGDIAAATNGGVSVIRDGKVLRSYTDVDGVQNKVILCIAEGKDHHIYAGSDGNGIYEIDPETDEVTNISVNDGLQSGVILRIVWDDKVDGFWISNGSEVALMTDDGIRQIKNIDAGVGSVFDIKLTEDSVWLMKSFGLIQISREDYIAGNPNYSILTRRDGLTSSITANSWNHFENGMLLICTGNGVYYIDINNIQYNTIPPKVAVGSVEANDEIFYGSKRIDLPADTPRITLTLDLLSYGIEGGTLEYYLEGFDEEPIEVKNLSANHVNYTNLPGGDYTFHLKGYNADGTPSEEITLPIHKEAQLLEHISLYLWTLLGLLILALLVLLIILIRQLILRKRTAEQREVYRKMTDQTVEIVAQTIDAKDKYTVGHSHRVAAYATEIGRRYGLSKEDLDKLSYGALLHDIGKIGIPDQILTKDGKLTDEEYAYIKRHPTIGGNILKGFEEQSPWIPQVARYHHERYDGKGYCEGLVGENIPLFARIVAVADSYDAMHSTRTYRKPLSTEKIRSELEHGKGLQFDERFAQIMIEMIDDGFEADEELEKAAAAEQETYASYLAKNAVTRSVAESKEAAAAQQVAAAADIVATQETAAAKDPAAIHEMKQN